MFFSKDEIKVMLLALDEFKQMERVSLDSIHEDISCGHFDLSDLALDCIHNLDAIESVTKKLNLLERNYYVSRISDRNV